jgi:hypothetical protein
VITCNRCGNMSPAGIGNCQTCGAPLSSNIENNSGQLRMAAPQEQPELPAWLESLRAGERSAAPVNNASAFSTADLIDDGALPGWMRSGRQEANDANAARPTLRPAGLPGPNTDDASRGINAQSLIDEQALPSWMHENKQATGPIPQGGISAASLIQPDAAPDWMKSLQNSPVANSALPATPPKQAQPSGQYGHEGPGEDMAQGMARGFSAGDLIDQQSLPSWMSGQDGRNVPLAPGQPAPGSLSPSSLPDMNSLSPWARGNGPQQSGSFPPAQQAPMPPAPNQAPWSPSSQQMSQQSPVWQPAPQQPMGMNNAPGAGNHLSASSFIDPNAVPEWMRSGEGQSAGPQQQGPGAYNVPPRVDNVRVPSRPRGEINPNQGNEAAANVFASMLGVASSAPNFIGAPYGVPGGQVPQIPGQMPAGMPNPQQGYPPAGFNSGIYQNANPEPQGGYQAGNSGYQTGNPASQSGYQMGNMGPQAGYQTGNLGQQGNYQAGNPGPQAGYQTGNLGQQGNYQMGNPQANLYSLGGMPPMQSGAPMPGGPMGAGPRPAEKPAKKGIFETIRDWFR